MIKHKAMPHVETSGQRKILFPIDDSEFSENILQWAIRSLNNSNTAVYFLTVVKDLNKLQNLNMTAQFLEQAKTRFENYGFEVVKSDFIINKNIPAAICDYACQEGIDNIIMSTRGKTVARMSLSSNSRAVAKRAKQPVLVIRNPHLPNNEVDDPVQCVVEPVSTKGQVISVLVPVSDESTADKLIPLMDGLLNKPATTIHVLHAVVYDTENIGYLNMKLNNAPKIVEQNKISFQNAGYWVASAEYRVGEVVDTICKYGSEKKVDQINLLSRNRSNIKKLLLGSVRAGLLKQDKHKVFIFSTPKGNRTQVKTLEKQAFVLNAPPQYTVNN